jgi:hypothetical protein
MVCLCLSLEHLLALDFQLAHWDISSYRAEVCFVARVWSWPVFVNVHMCLKGDSFLTRFSRSGGFFEDVNIAISLLILLFKSCGSVMKRIVSSRIVGL